MQRSGNHAVIQWLQSLFQSARHINDANHDFWLTDGNQHSLADQTLFVSFEDSRKKLLNGALLSDSVALPKRENSEHRTIVVLRDPYNLWASRVTAKRARGLSCPDGVDFFLNQYLDLVMLSQTDSVLPIKYNHWISSRSYRTTICNQLGGTYSESTLQTTPRHGGGSSFDGISRAPLLYRLARRPRALLSTENWRKLFSNPLKVSRDLFVGKQVRPDTKRLLNRWSTIDMCEDSRTVFGSSALASISREQFGFYLSMDDQGQVHKVCF